MKKLKLTKWVDAGRYMSNNSKYQYPDTCDVYTCVKTIYDKY